VYISRILREDKNEMREIYRSSKREFCTVCQKTVKDVKTIETSASIDVIPHSV